MTDSHHQVEEITLTVPWGVLALKCWNSKIYEPVLVVHGLCENAGAFDRLLPLLSKYFYYVVIDLPGHGYSSPFPEGLPLDFMNYVGVLQRVVHHFQWRKLNVIGHSFGAHLLIFFAASYTNQVKKLILIDGVSPTPVAQEIFLVFHRNQMEQILKNEGRKTKCTLYSYEEALEQITTGRMSNLKPEAGKCLLRRCLKKDCKSEKYIFTTDRRTNIEIKPAVGEDILLDLFKKIKCPSLVILATNSEQFWLRDPCGFFASVLEVFQNIHKETSVVYVPGNHCVHNNYPETISTLLNNFLEQQKSKF